MSTIPTKPREDEEGGASIETPENVVESIRQALRGLKFGEITITVRDGNVVQIERIARKRQFKL